jgi:hypothetical protein
MKAVAAGGSMLKENDQYSNANNVRNDYLFSFYCVCILLFVTVFVWYCVVVLTSSIVIHSLWLTVCVVLFIVILYIIVYYSVFCYCCGSTIHWCSVVDDIVVVYWWPLTGIDVRADDIIHYCLLKLLKWPCLTWYFDDLCEVLIHILKALYSDFNLIFNDYYCCHCWSDCSVRRWWAYFYCVTDYWLIF